MRQDRRAYAMRPSAGLMPFAQRPTTRKRSSGGERRTLGDVDQSQPQRPVTQHGHVAEVAGGAGKTSRKANLSALRATSADLLPRPHPRRRRWVPRRKHDAQWVRTGRRHQPPTDWAGRPSDARWQGDRTISRSNPAIVLLNNLDDVVALLLFARALVHALVAHRVHRAFVEPFKVDGDGLGSRVQGHGHVD